MKLRDILVQCCLLILLLAPVNSAFPSKQKIDSLNIDVLQTRIKNLESQTKLDETTRQKLKDLYGKTLDSIDQSRRFKLSTDIYIQSRKSAPKQEKAILEKIKQVAKKDNPVKISVTKDSPLAEIEQALLSEKANVSAVEAKLSDLDIQIAALAERPQTAIAELSDAKKQKLDLVSELNIPAPAGQHPLVTEARRWLLNARSTMISNHIKMLDQELVSQPVRNALLKAKRNRTAQTLERLRTRVAMLDKLVNQERRWETEQAVAEAEVAQLEAEGKHPLIQKLTEENAQLSEKLKAISANLEQASTRDLDIAAETKRIQDEFRRAKQKIKLIDVSHAIGQVLLNQRRSLPSTTNYRVRLRSIEKTISDTNLNLILKNEELGELQNKKNYVDQLISKLPPDTASSIRNDVEEAIQQRHALIQKIIAADKTYLRTLGELDIAHRQLIEVVENFDKFLAENLLWIRSAPPPGLDTLKLLPKQIGELISPKEWLKVLTLLAHSLGNSPLFILELLIPALLLWKSRKIRSLLKESGKDVAKPSRDKLTNTFKALGLTLLLAIPWPLLMYIVARQMDLSPLSFDFSKTLSTTLTWISTPFLYLMAFHMFCLPGGVAALHFRWPKASLKILARNIDRLLLTFLPAGSITALSMAYNGAQLTAGVGRLAFIATILSLSIFFYYVFQPKKGVLSAFFKKHPGSNLARWRKFWLIVSQGIPALLIGLAITGYVNTAATLTSRMVTTLWVVLALIVVHQLAVRWLVISQRKLTLQAILERRKAAESAENKDLVSEEAIMPVDEPEINLAALNQESIKLLNTFLSISAILSIWLVWSSVLPAFAILDQVTLWYQTEMIAGEEKLVPITLADLGLSILIVTIAFVAAKRLPSLLEIVLLQQFSMTSSTRYTIKTLTNYVLVGVAITLLFRTLGVSWSSVQWMFAALSVGIGFGLQEIVANFISGIIILFERPIRIGDVVTVGESDGVVTRINIRATTILTRDRKELLVPNKEFITGRLLNWSLSDQITRIIFPIGIAYGSDVELARKIIVDVTDKNEHILDTPQAFVSFEGFGDNSLTLVLRCFIESLDYRHTVKTDLHSEINRRFNEAGIVFAFPQRDIHLDTTQPLDIRIKYENQKPE